MIDIHSHILPGVDDGVQSEDDALEMLRIAARSGVTLQVLTPHIHPGRFDNNVQALRQHFDRFQARVEAEGIEIELRLAAELHIGTAIMQMVADDTLPWLGEYRGMRTFLLEFPQTRAPTGSINLVNWLIDQGVLPVIVHPERSREWQEHPERLTPYIEVGCPLQLTASSILGKFGQRAKTAALRLMENTTLTVLASDCHNLTYRPPDLNLSFDAIAKQYHPQKARKLCEDLPAALIA